MPAVFIPPQLNESSLFDHLQAWGISYSVFNDEIRENEKLD